MKKLVLAFFAVTGITSICASQNPTLWGLTWSSGAIGFGTLFNVNAKGTFNDVHNFAGAPSDGAYPIASLFQAGNGLLYGTTTDINLTDSGTLFSYNISNGQEIVLHHFSNKGADGYNPYSTLIQATNGLLYAVTRNGGLYGHGTIFNYNISTGVETVVYNFMGGANGQTPSSGVIQANNGLLYGTTLSGGASGNGILYSFDILSNTETLLHSFNAATDGSEPIGTVLQVNDSLLYGMTLDYGPVNSAHGTIYNYNINTNILTVVHTFGSGTDGSGAPGSLIKATNGLLYGTTAGGGTYSGGTLFSFNMATDTEMVLYSFGSSFNGGKEPEGSPLQAKDGLLYGTLWQNGTGVGGVIYSYNISTATESHLFAFDAASGVQPQGGALIEADITYVTPKDTAICRGTTTTLTASGQTTYTWTPSIGLSATTGSLVTAAPPVTTTYIVTGITGGNATTATSDTAIVTVNPPPALVITTTHDTICLGSSAVLSVTGAVTYTWAPSVNLNSSTTDTVIANPATTTTYTVIGTNIYGCSSADSAILIVEDCTGINQLSVNSKQLTVYPNPSTGLVTITSTQNMREVTITNLVGEVIYTAQPQQTQFNFELKDGGMYFVTIKSGNDIVTRKLVVNR